MLKAFEVHVGDSDQEHDAARDSHDNISTFGEKVFTHPRAVGAVEKQPDFIGEKAHSHSDQGAGDKNPSFVLVVVQDAKNPAQGKC